VIYISHLNQLKYSLNFAQNGNKEIPSWNPIIHIVHTDTIHCFWFSLVFPPAIPLSLKQFESSSSYKVHSCSNRYGCMSFMINFNEIMFQSNIWLTLVYILLYGLCRLPVKLLCSSDVSIRELAIKSQLISTLNWII
jgi:hypothetical protein